MRCAECDARWEPESGDTDFPGSCPGCGKTTTALVDRCDTCPVLMIEHIRMTTPAGRLLERVLELDFDSQKFKVDLGAVTMEEREGLKILMQERAKFDKEVRDEKERDWEMQQRAARARLANPDGV